MTALWMPTMKTHAFVVFGSVEEATKARAALDGVEWPVGNKNSLQVCWVSRAVAAGVAHVRCAVPCCLCCAVCAVCV